MEDAAASATLLDAINATDAQLAGPAAMASAPPDPRGGPASTERFVLLSIAATDYAVPETCVTELERVPAITPVPHVPAWLRGVTNLRGDILSVIDMRMFLGVDGPLPPAARMLVVRLPDEEFSAGLLVDAVNRIVSLRPDDIRPPASPLEGPLIPYLRGVCTVGERLVAVLDLDRLLRSPEIRQFDDPKDIFEDKD
jgi:purine-binding chemotaxis protein CheW